MNDAAKKSLQEYAARTSGTTLSQSTSSGSTAKETWNAQLEALKKKHNVTSITPSTPTSSSGGFDIGSMLGDLWNNTGGAVVNQAAQGISTVGGAIGDIGNALNPFSGQDFGQRAGGLLGAPIKAGLGALQVASSPAAPAFNAATKSVQGGMQAAGKGIGRIGGGLGEFGSNILTALASGKSGDAADPATRQAQMNAYRGLSNIGGGLVDLVSAPVTGSIGALPKIAQAPIGFAGEKLNDAQDAILRGTGVDLDTEEGQLLKQNLNTLLTIAGGVGGLSKSAVLPKSVANLGGKVVGNVAKTLDSAINQVGKGAKTVGKAAVEGGSQSLWNMPARDMIKAMDLGDEVLRAADDASLYGSKVLGELDSGIQKLIKTKRETGSAYTNIRKGTDLVDVSPTKIAPALEKAGVEFSGGKFNFKGSDPANSTLTASDLKLLNRDVAPLLREGNVSADQFLNIRSKLSDLSKFQHGVTKGNDLMSLARGIREQLNQGARSTVKGLGALDDAMSKQITGMKEIRNEFMTKDRVTGQYKIKNNINADNIANMLSPRNADKLRLLEEMVPGVSKRLEALSLVKKAERASEVMTGATGKRLVSSVALGLGTGNPFMGIASMIVQDPMRALKVFAKMKPLVKEVSRKPTITKTPINTATSVKKVVKGLGQAKKYSGGLGQDQQNV